MSWFFSNTAWQVSAPWVYFLLVSRGPPKGKSTLQLHVTTKFLRERMVLSGEVSPASPAGLIRAAEIIHQSFLKSMQPQAQLLFVSFLRAEGKEGAP